MDPSREDLKKMAIDAIDRNRGPIIDIGDSIFSEPELGFKEYRTADKIKQVFHDLHIPFRDQVALTGVIASLKGRKSGMRIAMMGELDAVVSPMHLNADPVTGAAHACGHNCMIASLAAAAYALAQTDVMKYLDGDIDLMAVPAEEYVEIGYRNELRRQGKIHFLGGKQEFIRLGEMDKVDIMVMQHSMPTVPDEPVAYAGSGSNGFNGLLVQYVGKAAHAGGSPHLGINALNAANIGLTAVSFQRETFQDKDHIRVHPIITKGGDLVNVVPEDVQIETYIRGSNLDAIMDAENKVIRAFKAGGYAVGARTNITRLPGYMPFILCEPLMEVMLKNMDQLFGEGEAALSSEESAGSTDAADVSMLMPVLHSYFSGVSGTLHGSDVRMADKEIAYIMSAKALVMTMIDLLCDGAEKGIAIKTQYKPQMTKDVYLRHWGRI